MLLVSDLQGNYEMLTDVQNFSIRRIINSNYEINLSAIKTPVNEFVYDLIKEENVLTYNDENFIIKNIQESPYNKTVLATHEFFELIDDYVEGTLNNGTYTIQQALNHVFSATTDWTFQVSGNFEQRGLNEFGKSNPISLFNTVLEIYGAEYSVSSVNKVVTITDRIGMVTDEQVRFKYNLTSINRDSDTTNLKTAVKVYYNLDQFGTYLNSVTYTSPNASRYRRTKWAEPIYSRDIKTQAEAIAFAQANLQDTPIVSIGLSFAQLFESGYNLQNINLGYSFFAIDERLNLDDELRIVEIESFPLDLGRTPELICSNVKRNLEDLSINQIIMQNNLNNSTLKNNEVYNGASLNENDGILIRGRNGVTIRLNADIGFLIDNNGRREFYLDTQGNVNFDGRLNITENGQTVLEAYQDAFGGRLILNDINGRLNVRIGSESGGGGNRGGTIVLFDDGAGVGAQRVELGVQSNNGAGSINLRDGSGAARTSMYADSALGPVFSIFGSDGNPISYISSDVGIINNERIATEDWVRANFVSQ